jgi:hypothetical protein
METKTVYRFVGWNGEAGVNQVGISLSTRERINRIRAEVVEETAQEVDVSRINADGIYLPESK